jgi:hypothetical protein
MFKYSYLKRFFLIGYIAISLPIISIFIFHEYFRFIYFEYVNYNLSKITPPTTYLLEIVLLLEGETGAGDWKEIL